MRQTIRFKQFVAFAALIGLLSLAACESDSGKKDVTEPVGDTGAEDPGTSPDTAGEDPGTLPDTAEEDPGTIPDTAEEDPGTIPDTASPDTAEEDPGTTPDTASTDTAEEDPGTIPVAFDTTVTVIVGEAETAVDLKTLETTEFDGKTAIRLTRIVEVAAIEMPWNHHYNFVSNDDFDVLRDKLEDDYAQLPYYAELDLGFVYYDEEQQLYRIGWDASLGFPKSLNVKGMGQGVIRAVEVPSTHIVVKAGEARAKVDISTLPTQDVVYYKKPDDGPQPMVPLLDVLDAAGVEAPESFAYKFYGKDGYANNDDNLMPHASAEHAWVQVANRRIIPSEGWDTELCCWSTRDTVLILGMTPQGD